MKYTQFKEIPKFTRSGSYQVNVPWRYMENHLADLPNIDMDPEFQRAHVWTPDKQSRYIEFILRGGKSSRDIYFNQAGWMKDFAGPLVLVDGKQRIEAVRAFMADKIEAFGSVYSEYTDTLNILDACFIFHTNDLDTEAEVLQWYLDMNSGGVLHTEDELEKVREMLRKIQG